MADPFRLLMLCAGVFVGLVVGVVPGIGGIVGLAMLVPLTYQFDPYAAFALLLGMSSVTTTSDTIPAILLGVPGTVGAVATVVDGHPMARRGEAARAFGAAYTASMIGGVFGALALALSIPVIGSLALYLKTPDFFAISVFGLSVVAMLAGSQPLKGIAAALLGLLVSFVGIDAQAGAHRWTFGQVYLWDGLPLVVFFLGLFGLPELAALLARGMIRERPALPSYQGMLRGMKDALRDWPLIVRCSWIGTVLGAIPGIGVVVVDWMAYGHAARRPGNGPPFGQGNVRGVIAPESANNAKEGGSLIPTVAFGVPGSASMTILLGALTVHGLVPGPDMLDKHMPITISMVFTIALANIIGAVTCLFATRPLARLAGVPAALIVPIVVTFLIVGAYQNNMSVLDLVLLGMIGSLGMVMRGLNWPRSAFALGFVLGPMLERNFFLAYQLHGWQWFDYPVVLVLLALAVAGVGRRAFGWWRSRHEPRPLPAALPDLVLASALAVIAAAALMSTARLPFEARIFPAISAACLLLLALPIAVLSFLRWRAGASSPTAGGAQVGGEWSPFDVAPLGANLKLMALGTFAAALVLLVGHLSASFVFVLSVLLAMRAVPLGQAVLYAAGTSLAVYTIFDVLVYRPWPKPILFGVLGL